MNIILFSFTTSKELSELSSSIESIFQRWYHHTLFMSYTCERTVKLKMRRKYEAPTYKPSIGRHPPDARTRSSEEQRLRNALSPIDVNLGAHHTCAGRGFRGSEATIGECHRINVRSRRRSKVNGRYSGYCLGTSGCSIALRALRLVRLLHFVRGFSESHPEASLCDVIEWG